MCPLLGTRGTLDTCVFFLKRVPRQKECRSFFPVVSLFFGGFRNLGFRCVLSAGSPMRGTPGEEASLEPQDAFKSGAQRKRLLGTSVPRRGPACGATLFRFCFLFVVFTFLFVWEGEGALSSLASRGFCSCVRVWLFFFCYPRSRSD